MNVDGMCSKYNIDDLVNIDVMNNKNIVAKVVTVVVKNHRGVISFSYELEPVDTSLQKYGNYEQEEDCIVEKLFEDNNINDNDQFMMDLSIELKVKIADVNLAIIHFCEVNNHTKNQAFDILKDIGTPAASNILCSYL